MVNYDHGSRSLCNVIITGMIDQCATHTHTSNIIHSYNLPLAAQNVCIWHGICLLLMCPVYTVYTCEVIK